MIERDKTFIDLFPTRIHKFKIDNEIINSTYKKFKKENNNWNLAEFKFRCSDFNIAKTSFIDVLKNPIFKSLHKKVLKSAIQVCPVAPNIGKWKIVGAWMNWQKKGETGFNFHSHSDSFMTCVLYINGKDMSLGFKDRARTARQEDNSATATYDIYVTHTWHPEVWMDVEAGDLVVFPSYQLHSPNENYMDEDRISIAYNLMPSRAKMKNKYPWCMDLKL